MPHTCSLEVNVLRHLPIEVSVLSHAVGVPLSGPLSGLSGSCRRLAHACVTNGCWLSRNTAHALACHNMNQ